MAGWGEEQGLPRKADVPIVHRATCQAAIETEWAGFILDDSEVCAGAERGKDACAGDGGAPLVCQGDSGRWYAVGLVSWGLDGSCGEAGIPGVYTRVAYFKDWSEKN